MCALKEGFKFGFACYIGYECAKKVVQVTKKLYFIYKENN